MNQGAFAAGAQTRPTSTPWARRSTRPTPAPPATSTTVLNALSVLSTTPGPAALNAISGQQYADFGTTNVQGAALFMNAVGQQMAAARGGMRRRPAPGALAAGLRGRGLRRAPARGAPG